MIMDLTQVLAEGIPDWEGCCGFKMKQVMDYPEGARVNWLDIRNGIGTHMDAPSHFVKGAGDIAGIELERLICPGVVINVVAQAHQDYAISADDINQFEQQHGRIPENSIVILYTGWATRWHSPEEFRNVDQEGVMHFPHLSFAAAELLLERNINGIAVDTLSPDDPRDDTFPVHHLLLGADKFIIENLNINDEMPVKDFTLIALPLRLKDATESPCRVVAVPLLEKVL